MYLAELWRYPIKSMAGEMLPESVVGPMGIPGDRDLYVVDGPGQVITARDRPGLLLLWTSIAGQGEPKVDGLPWESPEVARRVRDAAGASARLVRARGGERFDILPLSVATDSAVAALGTDRRRHRPNLLIGGVEGLAERTGRAKVRAPLPAHRGCRDRPRRSAAALHHDHLGPGHGRAVPGCPQTHQSPIQWIDGS